MPIISRCAPSCQRPPSSFVTCSRTRPHTCSESTSTPSRSKATAWIAIGVGCRLVPQVETTGGPVDARALGKTLVHEHLRTRSESVSFAFPRLYDEEEERARAIDELSQAMDGGVKTIDVPPVMEQAPDVRLLAELAEQPRHQ